MVSTRLQTGCSSSSGTSPTSASAGSCSPSQHSSGACTDVVLHSTVIVSPSGSGTQWSSLHDFEKSLSSQTQPRPSTSGTQTQGRPSTSGHHTQTTWTVKSNNHAMNLMQFPPEIIEKILSYVDYRDVAQLRRVCRRMNQICGHILSSTFMKLQTTMLHRFQSIKAKMPRRESARRQHPLACESDIIEMLHMRLALLQMSFGKHIERKHCCFFAGEILDEVYRIINYIKTTKNLARPYKVTDELFDLSTMAMEHFKEKIEPTLPEIAYFSSEFIDLPCSFPSSKNELSGSDNGACGFDSSLEASPRSPPQSNMVLRKRIHKIKQGMKRYSSQLTLMKRELKLCKTKFVDQQKTLVDYVTRLDEYDKKNEETSRKFSCVLQELNKCKTELQFFRSKFPFNPDCTCGGQPLQPLVANEPPSLLSVQDYIQVLSPQAVYNPPSNGLDVVAAGNSLESANIAVEVAAEPLTGSAVSPIHTSDQDDDLMVATGIKKQLKRGRAATASSSGDGQASGSRSDTGHVSDSEVIQQHSPKKQCRNSTRAAASTSSGKCFRDRRFRK